MVASPARSRGQIHSDVLRTVALAAGITVPFLYYGAQLLAAPFFPGFSVFVHSASMLGSDLSTKPWILNTGAILSGIAGLATAFGFFHGLRSIGTHPVLVWLTTAALLSFGYGNIWAGSHPLPGPRHNPGPLAIGTFLLPVIFAAIFVKRDDARAMKIYTIANLLFMIAMIPIMSGAAGIDLRRYGGLTQRVSALAVFPPVAVVALYLMRRVR